MNAADTINAQIDQLADAYADILRSGQESIADVAIHATAMMSAASAVLAAVTNRNAAAAMLYEHADALLADEMPQPYRGRAGAINKLDRRHS